jgi:hypothetical protein
MDRGNELGGVKLTGSWETVIGSVGDFTHILEYEGYKGFDAAMTAFRGDKVGTISVVRWFGGAPVLRAPSHPSCYRSAPSSQVISLDGLNG